MYNPVEYFDEMNILKDDKLRRKKTAKEFINCKVYSGSHREGSGKCQRQR